MKTIAQAVAVIAALLPSTEAAAKVTPMPIVPIISAISHWDNHWYIWLPQDGRFEAVEVMSVNRGRDGRPLVWVFFTERAGGKRQVHYVNDAATARQLGWHHIPIAYSVTGRDGAPRGVHVSLTDMDRQPITIRLSVENARPLTPAGLTDQSGHSIASFLLMFFRAEQTVGTDWMVRIGDRLVSSPGLSYVGPFHPAYSRDVFTAVFSFGSASADFGRRPESASDLSFRASADSRTATARMPDGTLRLLTLDPAGKLLSYADMNGDHALRVAFGRPLPGPCQSAAPMTVPFSIEIDGRSSILAGSVDYRPGPNPSLRWRFTTPAWASVRDLLTTVRADCVRGTQDIVVSPSPAASPG